MKYVRIYISIVVIDTLSAWFVYIYFPNYRLYLWQEDGLIENLSAFFFLLTFFVAFSLAIKKKGNNRALFLISGIGLLGFLDELSYGERLFDLSMPYIGDVRIDALHDFYKLVYKEFVTFIPTQATSVFLLFTVATASLLILFYRYRFKVWRQLSTTPRYPPYILVLLIVVFLVSALVIDLEIVVLDPLTMLEEMLEMNVGIGLLFCSLCLYDSGSSQKRAQQTVVAAGDKTASRLGPSLRWKGVAGSGVVLLVLGILSLHQGRLYQDAGTLWRYSVATVHLGLGNGLVRHGELQEAVKHYRKALQIDSTYAMAHKKLSDALVRRGELQEAVKHYREALRINPTYVRAHNNLGNVLFIYGEVEEAIGHYRQAVQISSTYAEAHNNLGAALARRGDIEEAIEHFRQALRVAPTYVKAHKHLASVLVRRGNVNEAIMHYREALRIQPDLADVHEDLGYALAQQGKRDEAVKHYEEALRIMKSRREAFALR
ncbi:MAG: tetratricopeptide repeat protein [Deltaproteobacteria bacterium]|nr:tetratricopeptide repeat protein [Deltaproteobacteria bacterium]